MIVLIFISAVQYGFTTPVCLQSYLVASVSSYNSPPSVFGVPDAYYVHFRFCKDIHSVHKKNNGHTAAR